MAEHLNVSWDMIKDIQKRDWAQRFARPKLKHLHRIAIDEIPVSKGHRYLRRPALGGQSRDCDRSFGKDADRGMVAVAFSQQLVEGGFDTRTRSK